MESSKLLEAIFDQRKSTEFVAFVLICADNTLVKLVFGFFWFLGGWGGGCSSFGDLFTFSLDVICCLVSVLGTYLSMTFQMILQMHTTNCDQYITTLQGLNILIRIFITFLYLILEKCQVLCDMWAIYDLHAL